jgi:hypothetical protein
MKKKLLLLINDFDDCIQDGGISDLDIFLERMGKITELLSNLPENESEIFFDKINLYSQMLDTHISKLEKSCEEIREEIKLTDLRTKAAKSYSHA